MLKEALCCVIHVKQATALGLGVLFPPFNSTQPGRLLSLKIILISLRLQFYPSSFSLLPGWKKHLACSEVLLWSYMTEFLSGASACTTRSTFHLSILLLLCKYQSTSSPSTIFTLKASHCHLKEGRFWNQFLAPCGGRKKKETQTENSTMFWSQEFLR